MSSGCKPPKLLLWSSRDTGAMAGAGKKPPDDEVERDAERAGRPGGRYCDEERAGRVLYRGTFGTPLAGGWLANALDVAVGRPGCRSG